MSKDLEVALEAARKGVETINSFKRGGMNLRYKGLNDLVTDADIQTEEKILEVIRDKFPGDTILAEETASRMKTTEGRTWIIDPIDGTTNFAYDFPIYCVSVGLWENGEPKAAAVIEVNRNEEFTAAKGEGAKLNGETIEVSGITEPAKALIATGFPYNDYSLIDDYMKLFRSLMGEVQGIRRPGAATYDLCCVAAGRFQGFYEYGLKAWDVGAASLIIREAGGVVTDWKGKDNWLFGERVIAGNAEIARFLQNKISEVIAAENLEK